MSITVAQVITIIEDLLGPRLPTLLRSKTGAVFEPALRTVLAELKLSQQAPAAAGVDPVEGPVRRFNALASTTDRLIGALAMHPDLGQALQAALEKIKTTLQPASTIRIRYVDKAALRLTLPDTIASLEPELASFRSDDPYCLPKVIESWLAACIELADRFQERTLTAAKAAPSPLPTSRPARNAAVKQLKSLRQALEVEVPTNPALEAGYVEHLFGFMDALAKPRPEGEKEDGEKPAETKPSDAPKPTEAKPAESEVVPD